MEPPAKRQRLGFGSIEAGDEDDELDFDPEELNQMRDPGYQLEQARDKAVYKLKSRFEDIFAKYEKDFTGVGDEIDLRTGEVVVDNGHLQSMEDAKDNGEEDDQDSEREEERIMHGTRASGSAASNAVMRRDPWAVASRLSPTLGRSPRLSSMMSPSRHSLVTPPQSFDSLGSGTTTVVDTAWQVPELPRSAFLGGNFGLPGRQYGLGLGASTSKVMRKSLPAPRISDEEDVLLGVSGNAPTQEHTMARSPLIKEKFPTVDSSPNNDPSLNELIQEVIECLPETPPSVQKSVASKPGTKRQPLGSRESSQPRLTKSGRPYKKMGRPPKQGSTGTKLSVLKEKHGASSPASPLGPIRGRKHSNSLGRRAGAAIQANGPGKKSFSFRKGDLDIYQDVTGLPANDSARPFFVEIEARRVGSDASTSHSGQATHMSTRTRVDEDAAEPQHQGLTAVERMDRGKQGSNPLNGRETFEPNVIDPVFAFSDEENLPPKKTRKNRRKSEPARLAAPQVLQTSRPNLQQKPPAEDLPGRNVIDPSYAFSDEENTSPRRSKLTKRISEPALNAKLSAETSSLAGRTYQDDPASEPKETPGVPQKRDERKQAKRSTRKLETTVGTSVEGADGSESRDALPTEGEAQGAPPLTDTDVTRPRSRTRRGIGSRPASSSVHDDENAVAQKAERPGTAKRRRGRQSRSKPAGSPELGESAFTVADSTTAEFEEDEPEREPFPKESAATRQQPSTPRSKSKTIRKRTPSSKPGLISLLSDNEDEEDEISFDLSAFTPSGHHRILAPRPHLSSTTTPQMASNSTASNKKRASSLLFGPSSTSKIRKHRTPGSAKQGGRGNRRDSTNSLARSVVKVRRESFRAPSPAGSVVQTPGGTKRRCGEDGFNCERDFCFVCISI